MPIRRDRLLALLDDEGSARGPRPVTLVTGPAGSGKTTLLATWAARRRAAWVTLDASDNEPATLAASIRDALQLNGSGDLVSEIGALGRPACLILDEIDQLTGSEAVHGLEMLIRRVPDNLRLVLAARVPPRLHLSRLRLEGRLLEIGLAELAFTRAEAESVLRSLSTDEIGVLLRRTEGWPAGLRMAAISLADEATRAERLATFPADDRAMADYLTEEVLGGYSPDIHQFLRVTSICELVSPDLATALSGHGDAGEILDRLDRANALVTRTPGGWYRFHPVLRSVLRAELDRRQPLVGRRLNQIAAEWFRDHGQPLTALTHAIAAQSGELIDHLLEAFGLAEILNGHAGQLHRLLPDTLTQQHTILVAAAAALDVRDLPAADRHLAKVDAEMTGRVGVLRAAVLLQRAHLAGRVPECSSTELTDDSDVDVLTLLTGGVAALDRGDLVSADSMLQDALNLARQGNREHAMLQSLIQLAAVRGASGELSRMDEQAAAAIDFAAERGWAMAPHCVAAYTMRSAHAYLRLDYEEAKQFAALAQEALPEHASPSALITHILTAIIASDNAPDMTSIRAHWRSLGDVQIAPQLIAYFAPTVLRIALRSGQPDWANEVVEQVEKTLAGSAEQALVHAVTHAHRDKPSQARRFLAPVLASDVPAVAVTTAIDAWLLEASLLGRADDERRAHSALAKALTLAEPIFARQPLRAAGPQVRDLLVRGAGRFGKQDRFVSATLAVLPVPEAAPVDLLTSRELDLLVELPSMRTTEEIADSMFVSVNTVKTHLRGIYRKLGVSHRRDAVVVARERGLL